MVTKTRQFFKTFFAAERYEQTKILLLSIVFFLIIGAYTIIKELKDTIFMSVVGREYVAIAKISAMLLLIPLVLFYSFLVDRLRRYQLLYFYCMFYGICGLISVYLIGHPTIGLENTNASPYRFFGWLVYFLVEAFSPFVISVFWSFIHSINSPEAAKKGYPILVIASKIGGAATAGIAYLLFSGSQATRYFNDVFGHQLILGVFSFLVLSVPVIIKLLIMTVPGRYLHGYEAAYQIEKAKGSEQGEQQHGLFSGLRMLIKWPYVMGIFGMLFFYGIIDSTLSYQKLGIAKSTSEDISGISSFLFGMAFLQHLLGLFISYVGTRALIRRLGEKYCLLLIPITTGILLAYFMLNYTPGALVITAIALRSINYAFAQPVRESLYIPTVKDMKFKSKSWIDAFGYKLARSSGSLFCVFAEIAGSALFFPIHAIFFTTIILLWTGTAYLLGERFNQAIKNNEVIGAEEHA